MLFSLPYLKFWLIVDAFTLFRVRKINGRSICSQKFNHLIQEEVSSVLEAKQGANLLIWRNPIAMDATLHSLMAI